MQSTIHDHGTNWLHDLIEIAKVCVIFAGGYFSHWLLLRRDVSGRKRTFLAFMHQLRSETAERHHAPNTFGNFYLDKIPNLRHAAASIADDFTPKRRVQFQQLISAAARVTGAQAEDQNGKKQILDGFDAIIEFVDAKPPKLGFLDTRMNLQRGFFRLTFVTSVAVGIWCVFLTPRPSLHDFRWRSATEAEKQRATDWKASQNAPFDPDMFLILTGGKVMKSHQSVLPFEFAAVYFVVPFIIGASIAWIIYAAIRFIVLGFARETDPPLRSPPAQR